MATILERKGKKGISYRAQVRRKGYAKTKTFTTKQAAKDWIYDLERDIRDRRVDPKALAERKTLRTAIELYLKKLESDKPKSLKDIKRLCN